MRTEARPRRRVVLLGAATVVLAVVVALVQSSVAESVLRGRMVLALVPCAAVDLERRIIPNRITGPASLVALVLGLVLDPGGELTRVRSALAAGGFLLVASLVRPGGMGMGDVKLTGMMGLFLGRSVAVALFAALIASVLTGLVLAGRVGVRATRKTALPFGPFLAAGGAGRAGGRSDRARVSAPAGVNGWRRRAHNSSRDAARCGRDVLRLEIAAQLVTGAAIRLT